MAYHFSLHPVMVYGAMTFTEALEKLLGELPDDSNGVTVHYVSTDRVLDGKRGNIKIGPLELLPIEFEAPSMVRPIGMMWLGYGRGDLESFRIPPAGIIDLVE